MSTTSLHWRGNIAIIAGNYISADFPNKRLVLTGTRTAHSAPTVLSNRNGWYLCDLSKPHLPTLISMIEDNTFTYNSSDILGDLVAVCVGVPGVQLYSMANPLSPALLSTINTSGFAQGVLLKNNRAYISDGSSGMQIYDITNPFSPTFVGVFNTPGNVKGINVVGNTAYIADNTSLQIVDISNPASPSFLGSYTGSAFDVKTAGNFAYIASSSSGIIILNVSNPSLPTLVTTVPAPIGSSSNPKALSIALLGTKAYI